MIGGWTRAAAWAAFALGLVLLAIAVEAAGPATLARAITGLGAALPLVLLASGLWHLARTVAWRACFPATRRVPFLRLARVRLAAEAFSYVTLRGIAGEPLKVVLLDDVDAREAAAAVALERLAYIVFTAAITAAGAALALLWLPLSGPWRRAFAAVAAAALLVVGL
ncbi:MAG TPA: lysylphosphatidylglycerol synthase domain-containing protein, partial [Vicinamibacterales bacterium]|nr:lysylphosphatidylglycerol synthase domain-containing protein [Vicinamibacterales bacterium]